ncbi:hypothetical protein OG885_30165 [Streptomyces sp. NBC_00028]|uniref:hypothetical protein n=1 Tax=Streptomyces sp. NBC_00028 TaxID=2975624 RepID=UPI00324E5BF1
MPTSPPQPPDDSTQGADAGTDPATPPAPPRRRRVRMLVDVVDQADEVAYVTRLFEERGWTVRPATSDTVANRVTLVVEVRLHGARFGALRTATAAVERLVKQAELGAWVRDAALVEHAREPMTTYNVHRVQPSWRTLVTWLGLADEQRAVTVPAGPHSEDEARDQLTARALGGRAFDPSVHRLRVPGHSDASPPLDESAHDRRVRRSDVIAGAIGLVLAYVCGTYVVWADGWWRLLPALLSTAGALPLGRAARETRDKKWPVQWAVGVAGTTATAGFGALVGQDVTPGGLWAGLLLVAIAAFTGFGAVLALRRTFFVRHAAWLVPLSVPVLWSLVGWLGGQMHDDYLDRFDIQGGAVPTPSLGRYLVAAEPMALALGSGLFFLAVVGWGRHFHFGRDSGNRFFAVVLATLLTLVYALTAIGLGTKDAATAAGRAAESAARHGSEPSYFGIHGHFMCLHPLDPGKPLAVDNGPAPTDHPVLSFGTTGDWIWLWDPRRNDGEAQESFAVRREDVQLIPAENPETDHCPPT